MGDRGMGEILQQRLTNNKVNNKTNYGKHRFETVRYQERT